MASGSSVAAALKSTTMPQEGQKRAAPGTALPQAGQLMINEGVYHYPLPSSDPGDRPLPGNGLWQTRLAATLCFPLRRVPQVRYVSRQMEPSLSWLR